MLVVEVSNATTFLVKNFFDILPMAKARGFTAPLLKQTLLIANDACNWICRLYRCWKYFQQGIRQYAIRIDYLLVRCKPLGLSQR